MQRLRPAVGRIRAHRCQTAAHLLRCRPCRHASCCWTTPSTATCTGPWITGGPPWRRPAPGRSRLWPPPGRSRRPHPRDSRTSSSAGPRRRSWTTTCGCHPRRRSSGPPRTRAWPSSGRATATTWWPGRSGAGWGDWQWRGGLRGRLGDVDALIVARHDELAPVLASAPTDLPVAVFAHGRDITATLPTARERRRRRALQATVSWLCLTDWMKGELSARGVAAAVRVPAAVPEAAVLGDGHSILCVGRLVARKGHDVLLAAAARQERRAPVVIVGDGPERGRLTALANSLGLGHRVEFTGWLPPQDLERRWAEAAVFAMPCRTEARGGGGGWGGGSSRGRLSGEDRTRARRSPGR